MFTRIVSSLILVLARAVSGSVVKCLICTNASIADSSRLVFVLRLVIFSIGEFVHEHGYFTSMQAVIAHASDEKLTKTALRRRHHDEPAGVVGEG